MAPQSGSYRKRCSSLSTGCRRRRRLLNPGPELPHRNPRRALQPPEGRQRAPPKRLRHHLPLKPRREKLPPHLLPPPKSQPAGPPRSRPPQRKPQSPRRKASPARGNRCGPGSERRRGRLKTTARRKEPFQRIISRKSDFSKVV